MIAEAAAASAPTNSDDGSATAPTAQPESTVDTTPVTDETTMMTTERTTTKSKVSEINSTLVLLTLSNQVKTLLEHFQNTNAVGFPGQDILPDPLPAPNVTEGLGIFSSSNFYDITVYGLSNFTVESVNMMLAEMTVSITAIF